MSKQQDRLERKRKRLEAEYRLLASSGKSSVSMNIPSTSGTSNVKTRVDEGNKMGGSSVGKVKKKVDEKSTGKIIDDSSIKNNPKAVICKSSIGKPKQHFDDTSIRKIGKNGIVNELSILESESTEITCDSPIMEIKSTERNEQSSRLEVAGLKKKCEALIVPKFYLKATNTNERGQVVVDLEDLFALVLYGVLGNKSPRRPHWCDLSSWRHVSQSILVIVDQGDSDRLEEKLGRMEFLEGNFQRRFNVKVPGRQTEDEFYNGLFNVQLSVIDLLRHAVEERNGQVSSSKNDGPIIDRQKVVPDQQRSQSLPIIDKQRSKLDLLLSPLDMAIDNFPLPNYYSSKPAQSDYDYSRNTYSTPKSSSPIYAIDCEMCMTGPNRHELTRISIIDEEYRIVLDTLVKPASRITDYLTRFSGITASMMENVRTSLKDVQEALETILEPDAILCGHSLNNDLQSMRIFHPYVMDTSVAFNLSGHRKQKSALRTLAATFLDGMAIQQSGGGHCSVEDAYATMRLINRKLAEGEKPNGFAFGNILHGWDYDGFSKSDSNRKRKYSNSDEQPSSKRLKVDINQETTCGGCGRNIEFNCRHGNCRCRLLKRRRCMRCTWNCDRKEIDCNAIDAETAIKLHFPPISESSSSYGHSRIAPIFKNTKKKLLWVQTADRANQSIIGPGHSKTTVRHVVVPRGKDQNDGVVAQLRSRMYEFDLNILELKGDQNMDSQMASIVRFAASKSLICVLFCERDRRDEYVGRCYVKVKE